MKTHNREPASTPRRLETASPGGHNVGTIRSCLGFMGVVSLVVVATACSGPDAPTTPSAPTPIAPALVTTPTPNGPNGGSTSLPTGPYSVSGVVTDGVRAIAGANVNAWVRWACSPPSVQCGGYSYMYSTDQSSQTRAASFG